MVILFDRLKEAYSNKRIFLTGHTGFKGAWMLNVMHLLGAEVMGYSLEPKSENDIFNLTKGEKICTSIIADIRNRQRLFDAIANFQPDYIFHLAAQPLVRISYEIPSETFEINAIGTANLLDAVVRLKKKCSVVLITTDKVYHNNEWLYAYRENDRLGGYDPYSASKACAELVIDSYRNSFFNTSEYHNHRKAIAVGRAGNVIGGGDWSKDRLIPDIAKALGADLEVIIRNPNSVRPWQHVLEPISGYLLLGMNLNRECGTFSDAFNFGPYVGDALPVNKMVDLAVQAWGHGNVKVVESKNAVHEAGLLKLDISKAMNLLGWYPVLNALEAVNLTIDWYKAYFDNRNMPEVTNQQINSFFKAASTNLPV